MRISRIHIKSFGALRDVTVEPTPGLNLFHGPNESGKTSVMEFIRRSMVNWRASKVYPVKESTDSGELVLNEDGDPYILSTRGKNVQGDRPPVLEDMPYAVFKGLFAMNLSDLDDSSSLKTDDVRALMVGVPGGDSMPEAISCCDREFDELIGKTNRSKSDLNDVDGRIKVCEDRIREIKQETGRYGELAEERNRIIQDIEKVNSDWNEGEEHRRIQAAYQSNRENYRMISETNHELSGLGPLIPDEVQHRHDELDSALSRAAVVLESRKDALNKAESELEGRSIESILSKRDDINALVRGQTAYERDLRSSRSIGFAGYIPIIVALSGVVVASAGALLDSIAVAAIGAVVAVAGLAMHMFRKRSAVPVTGSSDYEKLYSKTASAIKITNEGVDAGITKMRGLLTVAEQCSKFRSSHDEAVSSYAKAQSDLSEFLSFYGGPDGWEDAVKDSNRRVELESKLKILKDTLSSAGLDPDQPVCPVSTGPRSEDSSELSQKLGAIEERMNRILDDDELNVFMNQLSFEETRREDILRAGAVAFIAGVLGRMACDSASSTVRPGVLRRADDYLSRMTDGRYSIMQDSSGEVSVNSDEGEKGLLMCSSGLRSQVMLSVKLAMATEFGGTNLPLILDDVLLDFDYCRKSEACELLSEISRDHQILYFTCDCDTYNLFSHLGNCNKIPMGGGLKRH